MRTIPGYRLTNSVEGDDDRVNTFNQYDNRFDSVAFSTSAAAPSILPPLPSCTSTFCSGSHCQASSSFSAQLYLHLCSSSHCQASSAQLHFHLYNCSFENRTVTAPSPHLCDSHQHHFCRHPSATTSEALSVSNDREGGS